MVKSRNYIPCTYLPTYLPQYVPVLGKKKNRPPPPPTPRTRCVTRLCGVKAGKQIMRLVTEFTCHNSHCNQRLYIFFYSLIKCLVTAVVLFVRTEKLEAAVHRRTIYFEGTDWRDSVISESSCNQMTDHFIFQTRSLRGGRELFTHYDLQQWHWAKSRFPHFVLYISVCRFVSKTTFAENSHIVCVSSRYQKAVPF